MDSIDNLFKDIIEWQPSQDGDLVRAPLPRPQHLGHGPDLEVAVRQLNNGLLYALVQTLNGVNVESIAGYGIDEVPELAGKYRLINLTTNWVNEKPVVSATFQYKAGKTPKGHDVAVIEYTTRHNLDENEEGLTTLVSLYASQEIGKGTIDIHLNAASTDPRNPSMTMKIISSGDLYGELSFDSEGNLLPSSKRLFISQEHPLYKIYSETSKGTKVNPLRTAIALAEGFPSQRPLHIEQLVRHDGQYFQPKLL